MNIVIIEDEPKIADSLKSILMEIDSSYTVLKMLSSVKSSVGWLKENQSSCDLLLMDIQLSDGLSFEIFKEIKSVTPIIFITAYDKYALEAFEVKGVDYILKPFDKTKIKHSLEKFKSLKNSISGPTNSETIKKLLDVIASKTSSETKKSYLVYQRDKLIPLAVKDIAWFFKSNLVTYACTNSNKKYIINDALDKIQKEISSVSFYRANRQFIVRKSAIENITFHYNGRLIVNILPKPDKKIIVSKAKATEFKKWLS